MKIRDLLIAIFFIVALIICYWKFDDRIVTTSVTAACAFLNVYNINKRRKRK